MTVSVVETSLADQIFASDDNKLIEVLVPEWPGRDGQPTKVWIRTLPADESIAMSEKMLTRDERTGQMSPAADSIFYVIMAVVADQTGRRIFTTDSHLQALKHKSMKVLNRLQRIALRHNAMMDGTEEERKKDSGEAATAGSRTS